MTSLSFTWSKWQPLMNSDARGCVMDLKVQLGPMMLQNPILVASGTFGYAREMAGVVDFSKLAASFPKR